MSVRKMNSNEVAGADYHQIGEQLTAQYNRAVSGMVEVVKFGAMLHQVRASLPGVQVRTPDGKYEGGDGLKAWLSEFAPDIKRATAYRFLGVAEAVAEEYREIVGKRVADKYTLPELVLAEDLPKQAQLKQLELFDYVAGTSQRSWMDKFRAKDPDEKGGGGPGPKPKDATRQAKAQVYGEQLSGLVRELRLFTLEHKRHTYLTTEQIEAARAALQDVCKALK